MAKVNDVIKAFECHLKGCCSGCPYIGEFKKYTCTEHAMQDAVELLKNSTKSAFGRVDDHEVGEIKNKLREIGSILADALTIDVAREYLHTFDRIEELLNGKKEG